MSTSKAMTGLEEEMRQALINNSYIETVEEMTDIEKDAVARAAAQVAKKYIERAGHEIGLQAQKQIKNELPDVRAWRLTEKWLKENGIV